MIHLTAESKILLATQPADFRCGIDGLAALCRHQLKQSPRSGTLFVSPSVFCYSHVNGFSTRPFVKGWSLTHTYL